MPHRHPRQEYHARLLTNPCSVCTVEVKHPGRGLYQDKEYLVKSCVVKNGCVENLEKWLCGEPKVVVWRSQKCITCWGVPVHGSHALSTYGCGSQFKNNYFAEM